MSVENASSTSDDVAQGDVAQGDVAQDDVAQDGTGGFKLLKIVLPLLLIAALCYLIFTMLNTKNPAQQAKEKLAIHFEAVSTAVENVKDGASARVAAEKFKEATLTFDSLKLEGLPKDTQAIVIVPIRAFLEKIKGLLGKAIEVPGAQEILRPAAEGLMNKLAAFCG